LGLWHWSELFHFSFLLRSRYMNRVSHNLCNQYQLFIQGLPIIQMFFQP
jgi:hypothetical protein